MHCIFCTFDRTYLQVLSQRSLTAKTESSHVWKKMHAAITDPFRTHTLQIICLFQFSYFFLFCFALVFLLLVCFVSFFLSKDEGVNVFQRPFKLVSD